MKQNKGTLNTKFYPIIPFLIYVSKSRITNGNFVAIEDKEETRGLVYSIHFLFFTFGLSIPVRKKDGKSIMKESHVKIINHLCDYFSQSGAKNLRFTQGLFNLGINNFVNPENPAKEKYHFKDNHNQVDDITLHTLQTQKQNKQ